MATGSMTDGADGALADARWAAVDARDATQDGAFVYAVRTTGVYCRPSCPSRRAHRANVSFHAGPAAAEAAGFRACLRCRPDAAPPGARADAGVLRACRLIEAAERPPSLSALARAAGLSPSHFHRRFKAVTGMTPRAFGAGRRAQTVRGELRAPGASVTGAIYAAGYGSSSRFYEGADATLGMTPTAYRAGGSNMDIRFAVGACSLGALLVAQSDRGVCAVELGDDPDALARAFQDRFPNANLIGDDPAFAALVAAVMGLVEHPAAGHALPLDLRGTAFQRRVWDALRAIPPGKTATYAGLAAQIGAPRAVRAVAGACAANAVAVAIPCHRVVRTDGSLSGYRWGVERKRALLDRERGNA